MPRGRRPRAAAPPAAEALEQELERLKQRQAEIRQQLRRMRTGAGGIRKLEEKLEKQFGNAKWTVQQIQAIQPEWDDWGFYRTVQARQPTPRGRRRGGAAAIPREG